LYDPVPLLAFVFLGIAVAMVFGFIAAVADVMSRLWEMMHRIYLRRRKAIEDRPGFPVPPSPPDDGSLT
jgi:hypothetical protein